MNKKILLLSIVIATLAFTGCGDGNNHKPKPKPTPTAAPEEIISGNISSNKTLTSDKTWILDGLVQVNSGVTLIIEAGTTVAGKEGSKAWLLVLAGAVLIADGTPENKIIFTSEQATHGEVEASGQWGGVSIVGNSTNPLLADGYKVHTETGPVFAGTGDESSGIIDYVIINNAGIVIRPNQEVNGLNLFGVSASTRVSNLSLERIGDDGVGIQGGSVNLSNVSIKYAENDGFDVEGGWNGTMDYLYVYKPTFSGIEVSQYPVPTIKNARINISSDVSRGGIFFRAPDGSEAGGHFKNILIQDNAPKGGAMVVQGTFDVANTSFKNVVIIGNNPRIIPADPTNAIDVANADLVRIMFRNQSPVATKKETISSDITSD